MNHLVSDPRLTMANERCSYLLTPFWRRQSLKRTSGGALYTGADGPRAGAGRSAAWCEARWCSLHRRGRSTARGRTVRDLVQGLAIPA
jgi:hypothetical protein